MQNKRHRTGEALTVLLLGVLGTFIGLSEIPLLPEDQRATYLVVKLIFTGSCIPLSFAIWKNYTSKTLNTLVAVIFMAYTLWGQWHRPLYVASFMQLGFVLSFVFVIPKTTFRILNTIWAMAFVALMHHKWPQMQLQFHDLAFSDFFFIIVVGYAVAMVSHTFYTADRIFRESPLSRFSRLGFQSSALIHDLQSLSSAPKTYSDLIRSRLGDNLDPVVSEAIHALSQDLNNLNRVIRELNQLSNVKGQSKHTRFHFNEVATAVKILLGNRIKHISIENTIDCQLHSDQSILTSVLLNLFMNALENFNRQATEYPKVTLHQSGNKLVFSDNGGGFNEAVLNAIHSQTSISTKKNGGLGLWLIKDGMEILDGKATFTNTPEGACVTLTFPKRAVMTSLPSLATATT